MIKVEFHSFVSSGEDAADWYKDGGLDGKSEGALVGSRVGRVVGSDVRCTIRCVVEVEDTSEGAVVVGLGDEG